MAKKKTATKKATKKAEIKAAAPTPAVKKTAAPKEVTPVATKKEVPTKKVAKKVVEAKKAPAPVTESKPVATKKAAAKKAPAKKAKTVIKKTPKVQTVVVVNHDVGFGHALYIRGEGAGLSWEKGEALVNVSDNEWTWTTQKSFKTLEFKILIDDVVWSEGENLTAACGVKNVVIPIF